MKFAALFTLLILGSTALVTTASPIHDNGASDRLRKSTYAKRATGTLHYTNLKGEDLTIVDPKSGECLPLTSSAVAARNLSDGVASIFLDDDCNVPITEPLGPGASRDFGEKASYSIRFT
ncbi:hypothetical protein BGZ94_005838 [Podila epigama]|nr:hypothetical protein BGZ94_005838 [Podila epigama]